MSNILVSFSGGRSSAYMCYMLKKYNKTDNLFFIFANTGEEHPKTLDFVNRCDIDLGLNLIWVEADVNPEINIGTGHVVVDYMSASRNSEPYIEVIKKYGIPNIEFPHCNRELKLHPIHSWAEENIKGKYKTAIGIRIDEKRRVSKNAQDAFSDGIIYPLIEIYPVDKIDVIDFWDGMPFNLEIPEHYGNCKTCWKKSDKKLFTIAIEHPEWFDFNREMETRYSENGSRAKEDPRVFFRGRRSTDDIFKQCEAVGFKKFIDVRDTQMKLFGYDIEQDSGCGESCELYETE